MSVAKAMAEFDKAERECPFSKVQRKHPPSAKPCSVCMAVKSEACRRQALAAISVVEAVRAERKS